MSKQLQISFPWLELKVAMAQAAAAPVRELPADYHQVHPRREGADVPPAVIVHLDSTGIYFTGNHIERGRPRIYSAQATSAKQRTAIFEGEFHTGILTTDFAWTNVLAFKGAYDLNDEDIDIWISFRRKESGALMMVIAPGLALA